MDEIELDVLSMSGSSEDYTLKAPDRFMGRTFTVNPDKEEVKWHVDVCVARAQLRVARCSVTVSIVLMRLTLMLCKLTSLRFAHMHAVHIVRAD